MGLAGMTRSSHKLIKCLYLFLLCFFSYLLSSRPLLPLYVFSLSHLLPHFAIGFPNRATLPILQQATWANYVAGPARPSKRTQSLVSGPFFMLKSPPLGSRISVRDGLWDSWRLGGLDLEVTRSVHRPTTFARVSSSTNPPTLEVGAGLWLCSAWSSLAAVAAD